MESSRKSKVRRCFIENCVNKDGTSDKNIAFFSAAGEQRSQWISAIEKHQEIKDSQSQILVCELHFDSNFVTKRKDRNILAKGTIPTVFTDYQRPPTSEANDRTENNAQTNQLKRRILDLEIQVMKANERNRTTEKRLLEKTALLENTRKELEQCKRELKKLQKSIDCHPTVHSELLNDPFIRSIIECLLNGIEPSAKYNEAVRMVALNLNFLSKRAYNYLREKFKNHLPHPVTIRKWYSKSDMNCNGGFNEMALTTLSDIVQELRTTGKQLYVAISIDEMAMRQHIQYLNHKKKFSGFINFGTLEDDEDPLPMAKNAIVIMLNALNMKLTIPIAFFFITTLIAEEKAILVATVLKSLTDIGVIVKSMTSDGLYSNPATFEILGVNSDETGSIFPFFRNQDTDEKIYVFYDAPHMIKLIRNCLGDKLALHDKFNRRIEWKFIERLYRSKTGDLASRKLTKKHINWEANKMNVSLATQTFSNSAAESIEKLSLNGNKLFKDSEGTVEFLKRFNTGFDVLNSDKVNENNVYKTPINATSKRQIFSFLDELIDYIDGLRLNGKCVLETNRKMPFVGFKQNAIALKMMYEELVESGPIAKIGTTDVQQDLLESFFGRMRSKGGNNTNPTQEQFIGNFRQILLNKELTSSTLSNCIDKLEILQIPSTQKNMVKSDLNFIMHMNIPDRQNSEEDLEEEQNSEEFDSEISEEEQVNSKSIAETLGVANLAGLIEASLQRNKKFSCAECATVFELEDKIDANIYIRNKKNVLPCRSTYQICNIGRIVVSSYFNSKHISHFDYEKLFNMIKNGIITEHFYTKTNFDHCGDHKSFIIDSVIHEMIRLKCTALARIATIEKQKTFVRSAKTHDIHFAGQ